MYLSKKPLNFVKSVKIVTVCENHCSIKVKKPLKKHDVPFTKTVMFCENCFFCWWSDLKVDLKTHFFPFFWSKTTKKRRCTLDKNRYVLCRIVFFSGCFFLNFCHLTFCPFFGQKRIKKRCTLQKNRYVLRKFSFFLRAVTSEILHEISPFVWSKNN